MAFVQNFPFMSIILSLFSGPLCSILSGRKAKWVNAAVIVIIGGMSAAVLGFVLGTGQEYVYTMGKRKTGRRAGSGYGSIFLCDYAALYAGRNPGA